MIAGIVTKLTTRAVESALVTGKDHVVWDSDLTGFGLKITKSGSKIYVVQYRMGGGKTPTKRFTIGKHGSPWTAATARVEAMRVLHVVHGGEDPRAIEKERERDQIELRFDRYAQRFLDVYARRAWRPTTLKSHESNIRRWLIPVLTSKPLPLITRRHITEIFDRLPYESPALPRNLFALLRRMFNWAVERGDIDSSPMQGMRVPAPPRSRDRVLSDNELLTIAAYADEAGPVWGPFFRFLILTGQRRTEVAGMRWEELDQEQRLWVLPPERVKNARRHVVPLNRIAMGELNGLSGKDRWPQSGFVFTHTGKVAVSGFSKTKRRLDEAIERYQPGRVKAWRPHDLRRTVATNMQKLGVRFEVTEAILNHVSTTQAGVAGVYMRHDWADEKRDALERWADWLGERVGEFDR